MSWLRRKPPARPSRRTRILITRHGQTVANREGRFCGHAETELTDLGRNQAEALCRRLQGIPIDAVVSSDYSRAIDTAAIVMSGRDVTNEVDPGLREICYGEWEMRRERDVARTGAWKAEFARMRAEDPAWHPPGGETLDQVRERTFASLARIAEQHRGQTTLVVAHGTSTKCLFSMVLGMSPDHVFRTAIENCSLSIIDVVGGKLVVTLLNETAHLAGIESPHRGL